VADAARLMPPPRRVRWFALIGVVLLLHVLAIDWVARQLQQTSLLPKMTAPLFTRLLQPEAPPDIVAAAPAAPPPATRPQVRSIPAAAPKPARAASEPQPEPESQAQAQPAAAPEEANTPVPPASDASAPAAAVEVAAAPASPAPMTPASTPSATAAADAASSPQSSASAAAPDSAPPATGAAAAAAAGPVIAADGWPADTRLNYRLGGIFREGALHGSAQVQWLRQEQRYETRIDIDITLLASLVMTSQGTVTVQGLKPEVYEELRRSGARRAQLRDDSVVLGNGKVVPRPDGVQDTASQFVELSHRFASGQEVLEVGRSISLWLARPGGVDRWTYDVVGRETLQTPELGPVEAFHLKPRPIGNPRGNITAEMWFAPSLQYLPVRIKVNMDATTYVDLIVTTIQQR
jgi:hypothetical protein